MRARLMLNAALAASALVALSPSAYSETTSDLAAIQTRVDKLEREVQRSEDVRAIKKLQRAYGFYLDRGLWEDLTDLFTDDAVGNYPAGIFIGKPSLHKHFLLNNGRGELGYANGRLAHHIVLQPVVNVEADGRTAKGRWRVLAMLGNYGNSASWAGGVYENIYVKENDVWKIKDLHYYSDFGGNYEGGWAKVRERNADAAPGRAIFRNLPHPADQPRNEACNGFPAACIIPFHYSNPGRSQVASPAVNIGASNDIAAHAQKLATLASRAERLQDETDVENLQRIYGYYVDRALWDQVADLFAKDGAMEIGQRGVYVGKKHIRKALDLFGPQGPRDGHLDDHIQLQPVVHVAADGRTAKARSREIIMSGDTGKSGRWGDGVFENDYVKENGAWKIKKLHFFTTFITDYDKGWGKDAQPSPAASKTLPPDRPTTIAYETYPKFFIAPLHFNNPVSNKAPRYPATMQTTVQTVSETAPIAKKTRATRNLKQLETQLANVELQAARARGYDELDNLTSAYGYYLDKNLWDDLADLFAENGSMELAQRGVYVGRERVRAFLKTQFGASGPRENSLSNHVQVQPVIHVAPDGKTANIRARMLQMMGTAGGRGSWGGAVYENVAVKENGVWKFQSTHAFNTFSLNYDTGVAGATEQRALPGINQKLPPDRPPSVTYQYFPKVNLIPFHYDNPVTGRK